MLIPHLLHARWIAPAHKKVLHAHFPELYEAYEAAHAATQAEMNKASVLNRPEVLDAIALGRAAWIKLHAAWYFHANSEAFDGRAPDADKALAMALPL
ncbi:hypothetical protein [Hydrogenophaga sp. ANAO-22]|uniref:hypothetical protein n=1 Tax=Hydrogenophaga sp. ANAO-22 TaxID=3166645 RepID=UPI0036D30497